MLLTPTTQYSYAPLEPLYPEIMDVEPTDCIYESSLEESSNENMQEEISTNAVPFGAAINHLPPMAPISDLIVTPIPPPPLTIDYRKPLVKNLTFVYHKDYASTDKLPNIIFNSLTTTRDVVTDRLLIRLNTSNLNQLSYKHEGVCASLHDDQKYEKSTFIYQFDNEKIAANISKNNIDLTIYGHKITNYDRSKSEHLLSRKKRDLSVNINSFNYYKRYLFIRYYNLLFCLPVIVYAKTPFLTGRLKHYTDSTNTASKNFIKYLENNLGEPEEDVIR